MNSRINELENNTGHSAYPPELLDRIYSPYERLPELKLEAYAMACVETALRYSEDARSIYTKVVQSWELPSCQALIADFVLYKQDTRNWLRERAEAVVESKPLPDMPDSWKNVIAKGEGNTDFSVLRNHAGHFILIAFNRSIDLENKIPKVLPEKSLYLGQVISFRSLLDYLQERPELKGPRVISNSELTEFYWFCQTMASNPTTRMSRQRRRQIVRTLRKRDFTLHHYQKIADGSDMWYQCRVNPGTIEAYLDKLARETESDLERSNVEMRIAPYDEATGYPRKWRK